MLLSIFVDPPRIAFTMPVIDLPIYWYSILFAAGFFLSYFIVKFFSDRYFLSYRHFFKLSHPQKFADSLVWYVFLGTLIGARLGHVLFYDFDYYWQNPLEIIMVRKGGLASHGAALGIIVAIYLFWLRHIKGTLEISFLKLIDWLSIGATLTGSFIRLGNFFNQEILGTPTNMPWGTIFGHPAESAQMPCHPVQLYESIYYFFAFLILFFITYRFEKRLKDGFVTGLFFILVFGFRFLIEFLKVPQEAMQLPILNMGQLLSLPCIVFGIYLVIKKK